MNTITLVGSREAPAHVIKVAEQIGKAFSDRQWIARSGGAVGMDQAFLRFYDPALTEVYRPDSKHGALNALEFDNWEEAEQIVKTYVPHFEYMDFYSQWLHTRNVYQVLGRDLNAPSKMLICWARERGGIALGGTRTAVLIAKSYKVPVFNLSRPEHMTKLCEKFGIPVPYVDTGPRSLDFLE